MHSGRPMRLRALLGGGTIVLCMILVAHPPQAAAQAVAGSITSASGTVEIQRGGAAIAATTGIAVDVGDTIVTGADGHVIVQLTDQSRLELADSSKLLIDQHTAGGAGAGRVSDPDPARPVRRSDRG